MIAGLIGDVHDLASDYVPTGELFGSSHNESITWDHLLRQTSDWQGTLWDKPDWADRPVGETPLDYPNRPMYEPGTHYKYNDGARERAGTRRAPRLASAAASSAAWNT